MKQGKNAPCPCGSGRKYKHCCAGKTAPRTPSADDFNQLAVLFNSGRYAEMESQARLLLEQYPDSGYAWKLFGTSLGVQGKEALTALQKAAVLLPDDVEIHINLGNVLQDLGQLDNAIVSYQHALRINPKVAEAHNNLGNALKDQGQIDAAVASYRRALRINPQYAEAHNNLGAALHDLGRLDDAAASYQRALEINPSFTDAHSNLGNTLKDLGRLEAALASYHRALEIEPAYVDAHNNLGNALRDTGHLDDALASYRRALEIKPDYLEAHRNYLAALLYHPALTVEESFEKHTAFATRFSPFLRELDHPFTNTRDACKKLRIGYVSSDFRNHPVGRNTQPLIGCHDQRRFEIYLYGDVEQPDGMTEWFKSTADRWRSIIGMTDQAAAEIIRRDEIDILVLLAGRFDGNRPLIAAYRAAPVQVSLYDAATSGLKSMDYFLADINLVPKNTTEKFTERVVRLPTFYVHAPLIDMPDISPLPAKENGYITFGSFNNPAKLNEQVVALWAGVLKAVPDSRLRLKYKTVFGVESVRQHYLRLFREHGVEAHRIELASGRDSLESHLARYAQIDVVLDPFPFTGATATFESLWMGVPVVTLMGEWFMARWSGAMLRKIGLSDLVAASKDEYIEIARQLAGDIDHLSALRAGLRERVAQSSLCDEKGRARQIERAFRWMWAKWCAEHAA